MKKILMISPTPTHPANAGNRVHISLLAQFLRSNGYNVFFLYVALEEFDREQMQSYWGENLMIVERTTIGARGPLMQHYSRRIRMKLNKARRFLQYKSGKINPLEFKYNREVDDYFVENAKAPILLWQRKEQFDAVICEYAFMSKALDLFEKKVFKILDTHDAFTDRFKVYLKSNMKPEWISLYQQQERKALRRADLVLALQDEDRKYFEEISGINVVRFFCFPEVQKLPPRRFEKKLMYFASDNSINKQTLAFFEEGMLPLIVRQHPEVQLMIGGSICNGYQPISPNTRLLGRFNDPVEFYSLGDIVINPELVGTGFKIKTLEALCYGLPIVCTSAGAAGLLNPFMEQFIVAENAEDFAGAVNKLLEDERSRLIMTHNAKKWVDHMKLQVGNNLLKNLPQS